MRIVVLSCCLWLLGGCREDAVLPDGFCAGSDMKGMSGTDLAVSPAKCTAAKGLLGENMVCVDFSVISDGPLGSSPPAKLDKWDFVSSCGGLNWEIAGGKLQIKNFSTYMGNCGFSLPATDLNAAANQKFNIFTLAVVATLDINSTKQSAAVYNQIVSGQNLEWSQAGTFPRQRFIFDLDKAALPGGSGMYQPLFQLSSNVQVGTANQGWQIESIAINATP